MKRWAVNMVKAKFTPEVLDLFCCKAIYYAWKQLCVLISLIFWYFFKTKVAKIFSFQISDFVRIS